MPSVIWLILPFRTGMLPVTGIWRRSAPIAKYVKNGGTTPKNVSLETGFEEELRHHHSQLAPAPPARPQEESEVEVVSEVNRVGTQMIVERKSR